MPDAVPDPSTWRWIRDPDAAKALLDPSSFTHLHPYLARDCTLTEAARETNTSLSRALYHARRFTRLGLLHVARTSPRRGRPVKYYRSTADRFFVPFATTSFEDLEAAWEIVERNEQRRFTRAYVRAYLNERPDSTNGGALVHRTTEGHVSLDFTSTAPSVTAQAPIDELGLWSSWSTVRLTPSEAAALQRTLEALWRDVLTRSDATGEGRRAFTLRLGLTPSDPSDV
ncbi:ArsR/SmtB family transcription factor [Deinococcus yavapaiensis]|uniref:ArsR family transcriptional regulator n=1 Tax=Deinococcus yavapaiensis KR-236 TaxID=694435 RepID=A0A318S883_9DEIO|nr:hypothetical protein [Deinococcus yavapaiensis]PYE51832.1 hypothetical protein DES52_11433 [Deinococcus yavapaiensis KR-236]